MNITSILQVAEQWFPESITWIAPSNAEMSVSGQEPPAIRPTMYLLDTNALSELLKKHQKPSFSRIYGTIRLKCFSPQASV
jgi:hypothetical protein